MRDSLTPFLWGTHTCKTHPHHLYKILACHLHEGHSTIFMKHSHHLHEGHLHHIFMRLIPHLHETLKVTPHLHVTQSHPIFMWDTHMQSSWKTHTIFSKDTDTSSSGETIPPPSSPGHHFHETLIRHSHMIFHGGHCWDFEIWSRSLREVKFIRKSLKLIIFMEFEKITTLCFWCWCFKSGNLWHLQTLSLSIHGLVDGKEEVRWLDLPYSHAAGSWWAPHKYPAPESTRPGVDPRSPGLSV